MQTEAQKKASRRAANHKYYVNNSSKWGTFYSQSVSATLGTGGLGSHKLHNEKDELKAVEKEMVRIGLHKKACFVDDDHFVDPEVDYE